MTAVILPGLRSGQLSDARAAFKAIESRFEPQVRIAVLVAGLSDLYLLFRLDLWSAFRQLQFWWLDAMVLFWPLFISAICRQPRRVARAPGRNGGSDSRVWRRMHRLHVLLLVIALIMIGGAVAGSDGF